MNATTQVKITYKSLQERLKSRDVSLTDVSIALNVTRSHVGQIAQGKATSFKVAKAISLAAGLPIEDIFGDKYINQGRKGPKDRTARRAEVIKAIRSDKPVPVHS